MTYRSRLRQRYIQTTQLLKVKGIPHDPANSGLFVWLDLSKWLCYFTGTDQSKSGDGDTESREEKLYRYILSRGVVLNLGKVSQVIQTDNYRIPWLTFSSTRNLNPHLQAVFASSTLGRKIGLNSLSSVCQRHFRISRRKETREGSRLKPMTSLIKKNGNTSASDE